MPSHVTYELVEIERLLSTAFQSSSKEVIGNEFDRVKKAITNEVFSFQDERHLERYIQYHQQAVINLMDSSSKPISEQTTDQDLLSLFQQRLEDLLTFIERHFTKYFDLDAKAPEEYIVKTQKDIRSGLNKLLLSLQKKNADTKLVELVLYALNKIIDRNSGHSITYRRLLYAKELQRELTQIANETEEILINDELRTLLYYLNYNTTKAIVYHAHFIGSALKEVESVLEKIERLSYLRKQINQAQSRPGIAYNPKVPSLKSQLNSFISEEIEYLEQLQTLTGNALQGKERKSIPTFKLRVDISVSQIAYIVKVFVGTTVIQNENLTELLKFLVRSLMTKRADAISFDSIRAKFYNVESGTKESVKLMLKGMLKYIDQDAS